MLWIDLNFIELVKDDVPTDDENQLHDSNFESDEEEDFKTRIRS